MRRERAESLALLLIPALIFIGLYARSLDYEFVWTDQGEIEVGLLVLPVEQIAGAFTRSMLADVGRHVPGMTSAYYRPLQVIAVSLIDRFFGRQPRNFRLLNFLLGAATASLVGALALLLLHSRGAALLAGSIFAVHPVNLENYVWIAGLSQAIATFLIVLSLIAGIIMLRSRGRVRAAIAGILSLAAMTLALCAKENAVITPLLFAAAAVSIIAAERGGGRSNGAGVRDPSLRRAAALTIAQLVTALCFALIWRPAVLGGALTDTAALGGSMRIQLLTSVAHWSAAVGWLLVPAQSTTSDVVRIVTSPFDLGFLVSGALVVGSAWAWLHLVRTGDEIAALGLAWIWIAFAPTSGLIPLNHLRGERYLSLSLIGLVLLWPTFGVRIRSLIAPNLARVAVPAMAVALVLGLAQRSWQRMPDWRSDETLFASDVSRDPLYREGYHELAKAYVHAGDLERARETLVTLSEIGPRFSGHTSYLLDGEAIRLFCGVNLHLGRARDSLRYFADLEADSPVITVAPVLAYCGALSFLATGEEERGRAILEAIFDVADSELRADAALALARHHAERGRAADARRWLGRVPPDVQSREVVEQVYEIRRMLR